MEPRSGLGPGRVEGAGGSLHPVVTRVITRRLGAGFTILELLTVLTLAGLLLSLSVPSLLDMNRRLRVELASNELMSVLRTARSLAVRHSVNVALKFYPEPEGRVRFVLYRDGDGDGVLTRDIEAGIDPPESLPRELGHFGRMVHFGFPPGPPPWDPGNPRRRLENLEDPIRLNRSNMASFDPFGGSTPGSLYVTDGYSELAVVRILGRTGRVRILRYDRESEVWE